MMRKNESNGNYRNGKMEKNENREALEDKWRENSQREEYAQLEIAKFNTIQIFNIFTFPVYRTSLHV
jgi:hypothetical protein